MVRIIRPHGAIAESEVKWVTIERGGRFAIIDNCGNVYGIDELEFNRLKNEGVKEYVLKRSQN